MARRIVWLLVWERDDELEPRPGWHRLVGWAVVGFAVVGIVAVAVWRGVS